MTYSACFTGHRQIGGSYYNTANPTAEWLNLKKYLEAVISTFMDNNVSTFYSGMAIGVDQVAADAVALVRSFKKIDVALVAAIPFPSQPSNWPQASKDDYNRILSLCNSQAVVNEDPYEAWKMHARDKFMVENSQYVIAVWDGRQKGGAYITLKHGVETGKHVFVIDPVDCTGNWWTGGVL